MTINDILNETAHRPWEIPTAKWKFYQEWNNVIFLHWNIKSNRLRPFVPKELNLDSFEGECWVSLVAFDMVNIRPRFLPAFSPVSNFHEVNLRTYVKHNGRAGVYFLSIEASKALSCIMARTISRLPYRHSKMERQPLRFSSKNKEFGDAITVDFNLGNTRQKKTTLDTWLTERYALFQDWRGTVNEFQIHHIEWPIREIGIERLQLHYPRFHDLIGREPQLAHYSEGVQVIAWGKNTI